MNNIEKVRQAYSDFAKYKEDVQNSAVLIDNGIIPVCLLLAQPIVKALTAFRESHKNTFPSDLGSGGFINEEKWDEAIDEMIFAFEYISNLSPKQLLHSRLFITPVRDNEIKRVQNGCELFGRYFYYLQHMWEPWMYKVVEEVEANTTVVSTGRRWYCVIAGLTRNILKIRRSCLESSSG